MCGSTFVFERLNSRLPSKVSEASKGSSCYKRLGMSRQFSPVNERARAKMHSSIVLSFVSLLLAQATLADPTHYGDSPRPLLVQPIPETKPVCHLEYDVVTKTHCQVEHRQECRTEIEVSYRTEYEEACTTHVEKRCRPVTLEVPDKECTTRYEDACTTEVKVNYDESYYAKECKPVQKRVCSGPFGDHAHPAYLGFGRLANFHGYADRHRRWRREAEAGPEGHRHGLAGHGPYGYGPKCGVVTTETCRDVPVTVPRPVKVPICEKVPRTRCVDTYRSVVKSECDEVPVPACHEVPKEVPVETPRQHCVSVPHERCDDHPEKVARKVCHDVAPKLPKKTYGW